MAYSSWFKERRQRDILRVAERQLAEEEYWRRYWCALQRDIMLWTFAELDDDEMRPALETFRFDWENDRPTRRYGFELTAQETLRLAQRRGWIDERYMPAFRLLTEAVSENSLDVDAPRSLFDELCGCVEAIDREEV